MKTKKASKTNARSGIIFFAIALTYNMLLGLYPKDFLVLSPMFTTFYFLSALPTLFFVLKIRSTPMRAIVLVVTPYYNKATQKGLYEMYTSIADFSKIPIILYNVPSRTGVNIEPSTYKALAEHKNIVAIKEANGNLSKIVETMSYVHEKLDLYSGNDDQIVPLLALGSKGVISVLSNILPSETVKMCELFFAGDVEGAAKMQYKYHALIDALFSEVNPIPVKAAMAAMGFCENRLRLPLTCMEKEHEEDLLDCMRKVGIDV